MKKAGLSPEGFVRFHIFRKLFISVGASMGINADILKMLTGKRIKAQSFPTGSKRNPIKRELKENKGIQSNR